MRTLHVGCDHAGFLLKQALVPEIAALGWQVQDHGTNSSASCDYPLIAQEVCKAIVNPDDLGLLICGTGIGMSIAANRFSHIRAALCANEISARLTRRHNDANILCMGARIIGPELALAILTAFLESHFEGGRHQRRIDQINADQRS